MNNINNHHLTKKERYLLKKQKKEEERLQKARQKKIKKMLLVLLPILVLAGGIIFGLTNYLSREPEVSNQGIPKIEISPKEYDTGTISMAEGLVKKTYEIKNRGNGDLEITRIWTSCMCTTARLRVGDKESGEFSMHSNPIFWSQKIAPGQTGYLEVTFDPAFHGPQGTGPVVRAVYLLTNDPQNEKAEARLIANVIE